MNSLERAKQFIAAKALKLAVVAVPLAAVVMSVPLASAQPTGFQLDPSGSCIISTGVGSCGITEVSSTGGDPNGNWIAGYTGRNAGTSGGNSVSIFFDGSAFGSVFAGEQIPISWDFFINSLNSGSGTANWSLAYSITGVGSGGTFSAGQSGSTAYGTEVTGSDVITMENNANLSSYRIILSVTGEDSNFDVSIPILQTLDFNPEGQVAATPEPVSSVLAGGGLLTGLFLRRRKKGSNLLR